MDKANGTLILHILDLMYWDIDNIGSMWYTLITPFMVLSVTYYLQYNHTRL